MGNLLKAEWYKLGKDRSFRTLPLLILGLAALLAYFSVDNVGAKAFEIREFYVSDILSFNHEMIKLFPCILAGFFISGEYAAGTMKSIASSGNARLRLYGAKLFVFTAGAMIFGLVLPLAGLFASSVLSGFHSAPDWLFLAQTLALTLLYAAAFASIMTVFATVFTESGKAIGFLLMFFFFFDDVLHVLALKLAFLEPVWHYSVFKLVFDIGNVQKLDGGQWALLLAVPAATYLGFALLGVWIYRRKEIK